MNTTRYLIIMLVAVFVARGEAVESEQNTATGEAAFDLDRLNGCIAEAVSEQEGWPNDPLHVIRQLFGPTGANCAVSDPGPDQTDDGDHPTATVYFRPPIEPALSGNEWYLADFAMLADSTWRMTRIAAIDTIAQETDRLSFLLSSKLEDFDAAQNGPLEFLDFLKTRRGPVTLLTVPHDWLRRKHIGELVKLLDSREPCAGVMSPLSSYIDTTRSTIGNEAAFLIEGYREGRYPPGLNSRRLQSDIDELKTWWADIEAPERRAGEFVRERIGADLYEQSVEVVDTSALGGYKDRYLVSFEFRPPDAAWATIEFAVQVKEGSPCVVVSNGLPACAENPRNCCVAVSASRARGTVVESGLQSCGGLWHVSLTTHPDFPCIVWEVEEQVDRNCPFHSVFVNACTGEILGRRFKER